jgi:hypothetical protein
MLVRLDVRLSARKRPAWEDGFRLGEENSLVDSSRLESGEVFRGNAEDLADQALNVCLDPTIFGTGPFKRTEVSCISLRGIME